MPRELLCASVTTSTFRRNEEKATITPLSATKKKKDVSFQKAMTGSPYTTNPIMPSPIG